MREKELIQWLDKLAEALIKETRWGSATFLWGREWQKEQARLEQLRLDQIEYEKVHQ